METKQFLELTKFGRTDKFEIVNEYPYGYKVWNIGRQNFPFECFLPMCLTGREGNPFYVYTDNLKALKVESEEFAAFVLDKAGYRIISEKEFNELHSEFFNK